MEKRFIIIDGNSLINRAYYAMQRPMITKEGIYTQGIFGFLRILKKIKKEHESGYIGIAFDVKGPTFRHKQFEDYKANRKGMPIELAMQMPILKEVLDALNIKWIELEGYEGDDLIGTLAKKGEEEGLEPLIITGDKDELQLASHKTKIMITRKGISQFDFYDYDKMMEVYGFSPTQFIDCKALMGDSSDNVPGVPGIGEKTAIKLIQEYGSVEKLLENTDKLKGKQKINVEENRQQIFISKKLVTINTNVPIDINLDDYIWEKPNYGELLKIYRKLEFKTFIKEIPQGELTGEEGLSDEAIESQEELIDIKEEIEKIKSKKIDTSEDFEDFLAILEKAKENKKKKPTLIIKTFGDLKAVGMEGRNQEILTGMGALLGRDMFFFNLENNQVRGDLSKLLKQGEIAFGGNDVKEDYVRLMSLEIEEFDSSFDITIGKYITDPGRTSNDITTLARDYLAYDIADEKTMGEKMSQLDMFSDRTTPMMEYSLEWCLICKQINMLQRETMKREGIEKVYDDVELPLIQVMAAMEFVGFAADEGVLAQIGEELNTRIDQLTKEIHNLAGEEFNIKSPTQLGPILFEKMGLPAGKKTKRGYSTSADVLEKIENKHPIISKILEYRTLTKLSGTYIEGLIPLIRDDGRIHAHFNQTVAATGRISSSDPNLQNIPVRTDLGRSIRKAFVTENKDCILMGADYSQIELRVLAHMSDDPILIEAFNNGEDIHKATASNVLGIPKDEITPLERSRAKAVNFGVIYGMSSFGLSSELGITRKEADAYIKDYFIKHKKVKEFMDEQIETAKKTGSVSTILGRKRYIKEIHASNYMVRQLGERLAMNSPIQGSAADIIKIAMINIYKALIPFKSELILQVHDELIINTYKDEEEKVKKLLINTMEDAMKLKVKLSVDVNEGDNWYVLK